MVQRKVSNKLSGGSSLKPSTSQHQQDSMKNRGADMKKKIKKSRSIKHSDMEFLKKRENIPHVKREQKSPEKTTKRKSESTPNYMKSTSSSDAKKENSQSQSQQVSFRNLLTPLMFDKGKNGCRKRNSISNSKSNTSESGVQQKLKLVRTLTKTTSFKPSRNKCSPLVLTETLDFKRKTCSSTLKDAKFPGYLTLDPGGSEAEGTSAINVCPYTYCSLNGHHHHHPLPPLKSFMSARRRMLKTQRSIKLGCLSPRRSSKPNNNNNNEAITEEVKAESASNNSMETPVVINQDEHNDFFIDIYSKEKDTTIPDSDENGDIMEEKQYSQDVDQEEEEEAEESGEYDLESGNSDMDWEGRKYSTLYLDDVDDDNSVEYESSVIHQQSILKSDEASEIKSFDEESISSNGDFLEHFRGSVNQSYDENQLMAVDEINGEIKNSNSMESFKQNLNNQVKDASVQTEVEDELKTPNLDSAKSWTGKEECSRNDVNSFYQWDAQIFVNCINLLQHLSGNVPPKKMDSNTETNCFKVNAAVKEKAPFTANITIEIILTLQQDSSEKNHKDATEKDEKSNQPEANNIDFSPDETQCNTSESEEKFTEELNITSHESDSTDSADQSHSAVTEITLAADDAEQESKKIDMDKASSSGSQDDSFMEEMEGDSNCRINKRKISNEEQEGSSEFNPRAPNFLPLEPEEKPEKVDLRHQMMDDRRNTEEWMIDYALQKTLTKLAPARKKKVALLVEAFEKVMPIIPRCDSQIRQSSSSSAVESPRPIQACS